MSASLRFWRAAGAIVVVAALIPIVAACGESAGPAEDLIHVAGTYPTQVSLTANTCSGITVEPRPTTVTHAAGATSLTIAHGPVNYAGTLAASGSFTTSPVTVQGAAAGDRTTLSITGQFAPTGFVADVTAAVTLANVPSCTYTVHWVGTKSGNPNTIP